MDPDLFVFGPPGSGSVIICTDPDLDPSSNKQKSKKTFISSFSSLFVWFSIFELKKTSVSDPDSLSPDSDPAF